MGKDEVVLYLRDFKCFSGLHRIELKKLNILYGKNTSGKSALIDSLIILRQMSESYLSNSSFKGPYRDFGSLRNLTFGQDLEKGFGIGFEINLKERLIEILELVKDYPLFNHVEGFSNEEKKRFNTIMTESLLKSKEKILLNEDRKICLMMGFSQRDTTKENNKKKEDSGVDFIRLMTGDEAMVSRRKIEVSFSCFIPQLSFPKINLGEPLFEYSFREDELYRLFYSNLIRRNRFFAFSRFSERRKQSSVNDKFAKELIERYFLPLSAITFIRMSPANEAFIRVILENNPQTAEELFERLDKALDYKKKTQSNSRHSLSSRALVLDELQNTIFIESLENELKHVVSRFKYVPPIREVPDRYVRSNSDYSEQSEDYGSILKTNPDLKNRIDEVFERLDIPYEVDVVPMNKAFSDPPPEEYSNEIDIIKREFENDFILTLKDRNSKIHLSLHDVGTGISQLLPMFVELFSPNCTVIAVCQPELHVHPRLQGDIMQSIVESVKDSKESKIILIETHSESMTLRIQKLVRNKTINKDDINLLYVENYHDIRGASVRKIYLNDDGRLSQPWPDELFEAGLEDLV